MRIYKVGTPENWLKTMEDIDTLIKGQALTTADQKFTLARAILKGDAKRVFEMQAKTIIDDADVEEGLTDADFHKCIAAVTKNVFPRNALAIQKRWMCR